MKLDPYLTVLTKAELKWMKDLNVWPETVKLLAEIIGGKILDFCRGLLVWAMVS